MISIKLYRSLSMPLSIFVPFLALAENSICKNELRLPQPDKITACQVQLTSDDRTRCLTQLLPKTFTIKYSNHRSTFSAIAKDSYCIAGIELPAGSQIGFSLFGQPTSVIGVKKAQWKNFSFVGSICGWSREGAFKVTIGREFGFVSSSAEVTFTLPNCSNENEITSGLLTLRESTKVCEAEVYTRTQFGYGADDQMHFTALNDGTMKGTDKRGRPIDIPIKKGKDYRNADPAKYPCAWEETPEEVLKSFMVEHSE